MEAPNPNKRLCQNPNSFPNVPDFNQNHLENIIFSFLSCPDSLSVSIGSSFDRALDKLLKASGDGDDDDESVEDRLTDRSLQLTSLLHESAKSRSRKRYTLHNSKSWSLPHELTINVFSMLDTKSLMQASACCTMFNECAMDPLCYSHIDLTTAFEHADDEVVHHIIGLADIELRSLKLGRIRCPDDESFLYLHLTGYCLSPLSIDNGFIGNLLTSLHLYSLRLLDHNSLCSALSACSNLTEFKIIGSDNICPIDNILGCLTRKCEHLFIELEISSVYISFINVTTLVKNFTNITSLSLIDLRLNDFDAWLLLKNLHKLKYMNLSRTYGINGSFFRSAEVICKDTLLETLILRNCSLKESEVLEFWDSLLKGSFKFIRYIDISSKHGLTSDFGGYCKPKFCVEKLKEERPSLTFVADFT